MQILSIKLLAAVLVLALTLTGSLASQAKSNRPEAKYVRHFVSVKFKETTTAEQIQQVLIAFQNMKKGIPEIISMEFGPDVSIEKRSKGFTHGFLLTFASETDRDTYLVHPVHKEFLALVKPLMDDIFVLDFLTVLPDQK